MIAVQLGTSVGAEWGDWLGKIVNVHGPVIFYSVEERLSEFHRRVSWVLESRKASFAPLRKRFFFIGDRKDETLLAKGDRQGSVTATKTFLRLEKNVALVKPALIIIENAADVFAEEIIRAQVHAFVRGILGSLCVNGATMMLLQQPSLSGIADGTGRSGSTAWTNAGRWRLNFKHAKSDDGPDDDRRVLETIKVNYARKGEKSPSNGGMASSGPKARSDLPWKDRERERRPQLCPLAIRRHAGSPWHQAVLFQAGYGAPAFWRLDQNREQWKEGPSLQKWIERA